MSLSGRVVPVGGLTYFDANMGRLVTEGPDVTDCKSRLREIDPALNAYYDEVQQEWIITWWDDVKKEDTFVLSHKNLEQAYLMTLRARNDRPGAMSGDELASKLEKEQETIQKESEDKFREIAGDAAERLYHALKKDGFWDHMDIYGPRSNPVASARADSIRDRRS